ncbi:MAG: GTPase ObgE [Spirochaetia bacterium]
MNQFVDEAPIQVSSGNGGKGAVSFRREKYIPRGGPDGGNGGKGGDVVFITLPNLKTLTHLRYRAVFNAENGKGGGGRKFDGRAGKDVEIPVPPGCIIRDRETGEVLRDMAVLGDRWVFLKGGRGGKGNANFATSTNQAPKFAQDGEAGETRNLVIELRLIADIGLVGFPNAGKSSLLAALTRAKPKIAPYPFTTKNPNLGVLTGSYRNAVIADIPGLIEGASGGSGMGLKFLKHISRTKVLAFIVDLYDKNYLDAVDVLEKELKEFSPALADKPRIICGSKMDMPETKERLEEIRQKYPSETVIGFSSYTREGLKELESFFIDVSGEDSDT